MHKQSVTTNEGPYGAIRFLEEYALGRRDFSRCNLHGIELERLSLHGVDFHSCNLQNARLTFLRLDNCNLANSNLEGTTLHFSHIKNTKLTGVCLHMARIFAVNFSSIELADADGLDALIYQVICRESDLRGSRWQRAYIGQSEFVDVNLDWADLREATFDSVQLRSVSLAQANLSKATIPSEQWLRSVGLANTIVDDIRIAARHPLASVSQHTP